MMSRFLGLLGVIVLVLAGCGTVQQPPPLATDPIGSLPHSPKGYELYSWHDDEAGEWHHVLITGTNRLKTYEEMLSGESQVTGHEWVSLTARGSKQLKAMLARLPSGEQVIWISEDWLRRTGQSPGEIRLPGKSISSEIDDYCRQRGIRLEMAD